MSRTRIKICGITRVEDALVAGELGADALGLVFYPPSPRYVGIDQAQAILRAVAPFVTTVALFVNEKPGVIERTLGEVPVDLLQFHGDESEAECRRWGRPYIKAARVRPGLDLLEYAAAYPSARGLVLDAYVEGYGGGGRRFDWTLIPRRLPRPLILSGGLDPANVAEAIRAVRPDAVDVSSGVESAPGIKDARRIAEFIAGVRDGDAGSAL